MKKFTAFLSSLVPSLVEVKNAFLGLSTKAKLVVAATVLVGVLLTAVLF